jgi:hypothetical protein
MKEELAWIELSKIEKKVSYHGSLVARACETRLGPPPPSITGRCELKHLSVRLATT